jgi:hypothetical protein
MRFYLNKVLNEINSTNLFPFVSAGYRYLREVKFGLRCNLKQIGDSVFNDSGLNSIRIPKSVQRIGSRCFYGSESLNEVVFESGSKLEEIGSWAFSRSNVKEIDIPVKCKNLTEFSMVGLKTVNVAKGHNFGPQRRFAY